MKRLLLFIFLITGTVDGVGKEPFDNFPNAKLPHEFNKMEGIENNARHSFKKKGDEMQGENDIIDTIKLFYTNGSKSILVNKYDLKSNLEEMICYNLNGDSLSHHVYTYDISGNRLTDLCQSRSEDYWIDRFLDSMKYDNAGRLIYHIKYDWNVRFENGKPIVYREKYFEYYWEYDSTGRIIREGNVIYYMDKWHGDYENSKYYYDSTGRISIRIDDWWNEMSEGVDTAYYSYNNNGYTIINALQYTSNYITFFKLSYSYENNGKLLIVLREESRDGNYWYLTDRYTYTYDNNGNNITYLTERYEINNWDPEERITYTYEINNHILTELTERYNSNEMKWINSIVRNNSYINDNLSMVEWKQWQDDHWIGRDASTQIIDYMNNEYDLTGYKIEILWKQETSVNDNPNPIESISSFPNPFSNSTTIKYTLDEASYVRLNIYNSFGEKILALKEEYQEAGEHREIFNGKNYPEGLYFYTIQIGKKTGTGKLLLVK